MHIHDATENSYKNGYAKGREKAIKEICVALGNFFSDPPCLFNGLEEETLSDEWCCKMCGKIKYADCWEHAINKEWMSDGSKNSR